MEGGKRKTGGGVGGKTQTHDQHLYVFIKEAPCEESRLRKKKKISRWKGGAATGTQKRSRTRNKSYQGFKNTTHFHCLGKGWGLECRSKMPGVKKKNSTAPEKGGTTRKKLKEH